VPLITVTTTQEWHPTDKPQDDSHKQMATAQLGQDLPNMFFEEQGKLGLDAGTPSEAVQVDFRLYHSRVVNGVDIWMVVQFTETGYDKVARISIKETLKDLIINWFSAHNIDIPNFALDMFWGQTMDFCFCGTPKSIGKERYGLLREAWPSDTPSS
jgi:hypothetical protein